MRNNRWMFWFGDSWKVLKGLESIKFRKSSQVLARIDQNRKLNWQRWGSLWQFTPLCVWNALHSWQVIDSSVHWKRSLPQIFRCNHSNIIRRFLIRVTGFISKTKPILSVKVAENDACCLLVVYVVRVDWQLEVRMGRPSPRYTGISCLNC